MKFKIKCICGLCIRGNISVVSDVIEFVYCGEHSKFTIYPQHSELVLLKLDTYSTLQISFEVFFSVLSSNIVTNVVSEDMTTGHFQSNASAKTETILLLLNSTIYTVHVQVNKYQILFTQSKQSTMETCIKIFDGPGLHSDIISQKLSSSEGQYFSCKSFQAIIQLFLSTFCDSEIQYGPAAKHIMKEHVVQSTYFNFPSENCPMTNHLFCVIKIMKASNLLHQHFKLNVLHLSFSKHSLSGCRFAGLSVYKSSTEGFQTWNSLCKIPFLYGTNYRSMYSNTSSLLLVIYSYTEYANISGILEVTTTRCCSISVDICAFTHFCLVEEFYNEDHCHLFLNYINSLSEVKFEIDKTVKNPMLFSVQPILTYNVPEGKCIILQAGAVLCDCFESLLLNAWTIDCDHAYLKARETHTLKQFNYTVVGCVDKFSSRMSIDRFFFKTKSSSLNHLGPKVSVPCFHTNFENITHYFHLDIKLTKSAHSWLDLTVTSLNYSQIDIKLLNGMSSVVFKYFVKRESTLHIEVKSGAECNDSVLGSSLTPASSEVSGSREVAEVDEWFRLKIKWKTTFSLFCINTTFFVSVPGKYRNIKLITNNTIQNKFTLKIHTLETDIPVAWQCSEKCSKLNLVKICSTSGIHWYNKREIPFTEGTYLFHLRYVQEQRVHYNKTLFQSWHSMAKFCLSVPGHLPEFVSQQILLEFLTLLKLNPAFENPIFGSLYIGLKVSMSLNEKSTAILSKPPIEFFSVLFITINW